MKEGWCWCWWGSNTNDWFIAEISALFFLFKILLPDLRINLTAVNQTEEGSDLTFNWGLMPLMRVFDS